MEPWNPTKEDLVEYILQNETFLPDSGLILRLRKVLLKLSRSNLSDLKLVIDSKLIDKVLPTDTNSQK